MSESDKQPVAVIGEDGATDKKRLHDVGTSATAQDKDTCVVYGMHAIAVERGGVDVSLSLLQLAEALLMGRTWQKQKQAANG